MPSLADFHYDLPGELIAQRPADRREAARLMVVDRATGTIAHYHVHELPKLLRAGDLLVVNDTRVVRARVFAVKPTGGRVELLFHGLPSAPEGAWSCACLTRSSKPLRPGTELRVDGGGRIVVREVPAAGEAVVAAAEGAPPFFELLERCGEVPLPPYIQRSEAGPDDMDAARYQTVFAREPGAVAAPTAGLHFTESLFDELAAQGIGHAPVTLHVGPGTFLPIREDDYTRHTLLPEQCAVSPETAAAVNAHRPPEGRVVAVGTTSVRTLEWAADDDGRVEPVVGATNVYVTPGYRFRAVDALLTNFHLPGSSLLLLVAAFAGRELLLEAYEQAVQSRYRFYSYGDAMLIQ